MKQFTIFLLSLTIFVSCTKTVDQPIRLQEVTEKPFKSSVIDSVLKTKPVPDSTLKHYIDRKPVLPGKFKKRG